VAETADKSIEVPKTYDTFFSSSSIVVVSAANNSSEATFTNSRLHY
jgi:hypothetical protein